MWDNLGRVAGEYAHLHRIWERVSLQGEELIPGIRDSGKPAIFFGAHLANWELCAVGAKDQRVLMVKLSSTASRTTPASIAGCSHATLLPASTAHIQKGAAGAREMLAVLKRNGVLGILMDQKLNEGMAIPFFGRDAMTAPALALFALQLWLPRLSNRKRIERLNGCHFKMTIYPALETPRTGNQEQDTRAMLVEINRLLESLDPRTARTSGY